MCCSMTGTYSSSRREFGFVLSLSIEGWPVFVTFLLGVAITLTKQSKEGRVDFG